MDCLQQWGLDLGGKVCEEHLGTDRLIRKGIQHRREVHAHPVLGNCLKHRGKINLHYLCFDNMLEFCKVI